MDFGWQWRVNGESSTVANILLWWVADFGGGYTYVGTAGTWENSVPFTLLWTYRSTLKNKVYKLSTTGWISSEALMCNSVTSW